MGGDYEPILNDALDEIPEATGKKSSRLMDMTANEAAGKLPETYAAQRRWIGKLGTG